MKGKSPKDAFMRKLLCVLTSADNGVSAEEEALAAKPPSAAADPLHGRHRRTELRLLCRHQRWRLPARPLQF